jgi:O-methyltransferase
MKKGEGPWATTSPSFPATNVCLVEGKVEETIPQTLPARICLLRLDTDWYESTRHELTYLYPNLVKNGVLIIDDYGHWLGSKQATDEYFEQRGLKPFSNALTILAESLSKQKTAFDAIVS